jgi:hypothetical protein
MACRLVEFRLGRMAAVLLIGSSGALRLRVSPGPVVVFGGACAFSRERGYGVGFCQVVRWLLVLARGLCGG